MDEKSRGSAQALPSLACVFIYGVVYNNEAYYGNTTGLNTPSSAFGTGTVTITCNTIELAYQLRPRVDLGGKTVTNTFVLETFDAWNDFYRYGLN